MILGLVRNTSQLGKLLIVLALALAAVLALSPLSALAQEAAPAAPATEAAAEPAAAPEDPAAATEAADAEAKPAGSYIPMKPKEGIGMPVQGGLDVQPQFSDIGKTATVFHTALVWIMAIISVFVLGLLVYTMWRFRKSANPVPSKTTHNTMIEVIWTLVPVLILIGIAIPSISLLAKQYEVPPKDAITIKVTGYQWYWGYTYPDNGGFEVISNMLPEEEAMANGEPSHLAVDNRMVVPVGVPLRIQTTAADVIHSFAVPAIWFKVDAVPGRLNEKLVQIDEPGVYYGQCSELCGARHGYMPIAVEALPMEQWKAWVREQGGTFADEEAAKAAAAAPAAAPAGAPAAATPAAAPAPSATPAPAA